MSNETNGGGRRNFIKQVACGVAGGLALQGGVTIGRERIRQETQAFFGFAAQPVLANVRDTTIDVIIVPNGLATAWVEYGPSRQLGHTAKGSIQGLLPTSDRVIHCPISGLEPGRQYFYRVHLQQVVYSDKWRMQRTEKVASEIFSFHTLDVAADTASFTCWNDTHENDETLARLTELLDIQRPNFMLWNGDVTNNIFREEQIVGQFLRPGNQAFATSIPVMLSRGNHDVRGQEALYLRDYMAGPDGHYHYGFRQGPLACLVLDTGEDKKDDHAEYGGLADFAAYRLMQAEWLEAIIEQPWFKSAPFRIAFMHIPLISGRNIGNDGDAEKCLGWICEDSYNKWHSHLIKGNVQLVISGHTHRPAYFPPDDKRTYGQLIGGGPQPERATCITGHADDTMLTVTMTNLHGDVLEKLRFSS